MIRGMSTITTNSETWIGCVLTDGKERKLGTIADIYYDEATERSTWMLVKTGVFGSKHTLVPLAGAVAAHDTIQTPHTKRQVDHAPHVDPADTLTDDELRGLFEHFDVRLDAPADNDPQAGAPLAPLAERVLSYIAVDDDCSPPASSQTPAATGGR